MDLNRYVTTGNLTADPILKTLSGGTPVCELRIANNGLGRGDREAVGYLDVTVYGKSAEVCARYLAKGRPIAVDGRLEWREWTQDDGQRRSAIDLIANTVKFLGSRDATPDNGEPGQEPAAVTSDPEDTPF